MKPPATLKLRHRCEDCDLRSDHFFCSVGRHALLEFESFKITNSYPKGATLFGEGQPSEGVYMLCQGRVKLSTYSKDGKVIILRIADAGEILGLSAVVSDYPHEATAEVLEPCQVNFVVKKDFLRFLSENGDVGLHAISQLSKNYYRANTQIRSLGLSNSAADKLARLFLEWGLDNGAVNNHNTNGNGVLVKVPYTHEEIAEMIGTSRETVTRLLKVFKDRKLISDQGSSLYIFDLNGISAVIGVRHL